MSSQHGDVMAKILRLGQAQALQQNIVKERKHKLTDIRAKHIVHQSLEYCQRISETKCLDEELENAVWVQIVVLRCNRGAYKLCGIPSKGPIWWKSGHPSACPVTCQWPGCEKTGTLPANPFVVPGSRRVERLPVGAAGVQQGNVLAVADANDHVLCVASAQWWRARTRSWPSGSSGFSLVVVQPTWQILWLIETRMY